MRPWLGGGVGVGFKNRPGTNVVELVEGYKSPLG